jgi:hypothetical protein
MRSLILAGSAVFVAALSGCASTNQGVGSYSDQLRELADSCEARGGILAPRPGPQSGRPEVDNVCRITGGASRIGEN